MLAKSGIQLLILLGLSNFLQCRPFKNAIHGDGVMLNATGEVELVLPGKLSFTFGKLCEGVLGLCYETTPMSDSTRNKYDNAARKCAQDTCFLTVNPQTESRIGALGITDSNDAITATFDNNNKAWCPLKAINGRQKFYILNMPKCHVNVVGASLPLAVKHDEVEKDSKEVVEEASSEQSVKTTDLRWVVVPVTIVILLVVFGIIGFVIYKACKKPQDQVIPQPDLEQQKIIEKSPIASATSPIAPVSPPPTVTPKSPKQAVTSPTIAPTSREVLSQGERIKKEKKSRPTPTITDAVTSTAKDISPPFEMAAKWSEDAPRSLHRNGFLRYVGMHPCRSGSQLDPFLQNVFEIYEPFPARRKIVDWEVMFFLQIVSDAMVEAPKLIKDARQQLCRHGAIFDHRNFCSFNKTTRRFISRTDTPGFVAWYAFASEHGNEVKIADDDRVDVFLRRLSVPALLTVFFRENLEIEVRRSAYAHLRRLQTQVACMHPNRILLGMPYPVCLIPDLLKKDARRFREGANDLTYSTPLEVLKQIKKYETTEEDEVTDETQVTYSDGKKRDVLGSVEVIGTQTTASQTVQEDWFN
uniref:SUEL-type lectin domain-containing protein n=1 Tax=Panagrellus redivivus TaxID=6233 RepID=A0A7E4VPM4_PANRE